MKPSRKNWIFSTAAVLTGAVAAAMRLWLESARDGKGLLAAGHPAQLLLCLLTAVVTASVVAAAWKEKGDFPWARNFPACVFGCCGCVVFAAGILAHVVLHRSTPGLPSLVENLLGFLAVPSLVVMGICRKLGKRPFFLFPAVVCLYVTIYTIGRYQSWSGTPQFINSFFSMAACLMLMLCSHQHTSFAVNMGSRRLLLIFGLLAGFFSLAAAAGSEAWLFHLPAGLWAVSSLPSLTSEKEASRSEP